MSDISIPVLIVGAGPTGLITALNLAQRGVTCIILDKSKEATDWPKMDLTNCRSMEILKQIGISEELRAQGVPEHFSLDVLFSSGFHGSNLSSKIIAKWSHFSPAKYHQHIAKENDGTMPREPYQRVMQSILERILRRRCSETLEVTMLIGSFENLEEHEEEVQSIARLADTNATVTIRSKYVVGCDGAKSRVRKTIGIGGLGEQLPVKFFLVHFRSRDLVRLQSQGQFWHIFYTNGGILISQDEKEIWTVHLPFPLDVDTSTVDSLSVIYTVLGGSIGPFEVQVDEVMIGNTWRPGTYIADSYRSPLGRVFLAGDSAHQCIPTGAYGMNTGVEDAYDIAWKLAAVLLGFGGEQLLRSYEIERRPIGLRNSSRSSELMHKHLQYLEWIRNAPNDCLTSFGSEEGELLRQKVADYITKNDTEITENGMVLDHRHLDSPVLALDLQLNEQEPPWILTHYTPSTLPGHRAPHLILSDGLTSIYALYGPWYSIVDFSSHGSVAATFSDIAFQLRIPLKLIRLPLELHVKNIWKCEAVLLRPDGHVAWQKSPTGNVDNVDTIRTALLTATGLR